MSTCPRIAACPLFAQFKVRSSLKVWQSFYCEGDHQRCERYQRVVVGQPVAPCLLPNGRLLEVPLEQLEPVHFQEWGGPRGG